MAEKSSQIEHGDSSQSAAPTPREVVRAAEQLPLAEQQHVINAISQQFSLEERSVDPLIEKINAEHIHKAMDNLAEEVRSEHDLLRIREQRRSSNRWFALATLTMVLLFVAFACIWFASDRETLEVVLAFIGGLAAGGLGGYGYAKAGASEASSD